MVAKASYDYGASSPIARDIKNQKHKLLTHDQEIALFRRAEDGDQDAFNLLFESNLRLVFSIAAKMTVAGTFDDKYQNGALGLYHSLFKFDWRMGNKFSTYATLWIRQTIHRGAHREGIIRLPVFVKDTLTRFQRQRDRLTSKLGREVSDGEVWSSLGGKPSLINDALNASEVVSLDLPVIGETDEESSLGDFIADPRVDVEGDLIAAERSKALRAAIASLPTQQREVLTLLLYGESVNPSRRLGLTVEETGKRLGLDREHVRAIKDRAMKRLVPFMQSWNGDHGADFRL
jgi:RNA polymerase primary sigma factor